MRLVSNELEPADGEKIDEALLKRMEDEGFRKMNQTRAASVIRPSSKTTAGTEPSTSSAAIACSQ